MSSWWRIAVAKNLTECERWLSNFSPYRFTYSLIHHSLLHSLVLTWNLPPPEAHREPSPCPRSFRYPSTQPLQSRQLEPRWAQQREEEARSDERREERTIEERRQRPRRRQDRRRRRRCRVKASRPRERWVRVKHEWKGWVIWVRGATRIGCVCTEAIDDRMKSSRDIGSRKKIN